MSTDSKQELIIEASNLSTVRDLVGAEIDVQVATAKNWPRSMGGFQANLLKLATQSTEIAESCEYAVPRDGQVITGPSARFAELVAFSFGNLRVAGRVVSIDDKFVTAQGIAHDLESNTAKMIEVKRGITNKKGRYSDNLIQTIAQSAISIAARNATLACVPQALWAEAYAASQQTAEGSKTDLPMRRQKMVEAWGAMGVAPQRVLRRAGVESLDEITQAKLKFLRSLYVAVKDGDMSIEELFPTATRPAEGNGASGLDKLASATVLGADRQPADSPTAEKSPQEAKIGDRPDNRPTNVSPADTDRQAPPTAPAAVDNRSTEPVVPAPTVPQSAPDKPADSATGSVGNGWDGEISLDDSPEAVDEPAQEDVSVLTPAAHTALVDAYGKKISSSISQGRLTSLRSEVLDDKRLEDEAVEALLDQIKAQEARLK